MSEARDYMHDLRLIKFGAYVDCMGHTRSYDGFDSILCFDLECTDPTNFEERHDLTVFPPRLWETSEYTPGCLLKLLDDDLSFVLCYEDGAFMSVLDDSAGIAGLAGLYKLVDSIVNVYAPPVHVEEDVFGSAAELLSVLAEEDLAAGAMENMHLVGDPEAGEMCTH
jgi:hypothetical protein